VGRLGASAGPFAGASEDRPPRVLSSITPPVRAGCAWRGGPTGATRGGKPSEVERWARRRPQPAVEQSVYFFLVAGKTPFGWMNTRPVTSFFSTRNRTLYPSSDLIRNSVPI